MEDQVQIFFQNIKQLLMTTSILWIADPNVDFVVCTDASKEGIGGVLLQNDHAIYCQSWKLKENEQKYPTHDLDLTSIIHTLNMWHH